MLAGNQPPKRILVRGVNWLGDAVMTTPALMRLREALPDAKIVLLTHEKLAGLWPCHPALDGLITFSPAESPWRIGRRLRAGLFDLSLVLPNSPRSALEVWLGRIPERVGYARSWRNWWLTRTVPLPAETVPMHPRSVRHVRRAIRRSQPASIPPITTASHHIHYYLRLVEVLGASGAPMPTLVRVPDNEVERVCAQFGLVAGLVPSQAHPFLAAGPQSEGSPERDHPFVPLLGLNPGAEYGPAKRWPKERFIDAAVCIHRRTRCHWLILGGPGEAGLGAEIEGAVQSACARGAGSNAAAPSRAATNLAGRTTLRELCALLKACRVLLTNDSGPMHVAAALGTRVVALFGSTSPELTGPGVPGDSRHRLLRSSPPCAPCFRRVCPIDFRCMNQVSVEAVVDAVLGLIPPA